MAAAKRKSTQISKNPYFDLVDSEDEDPNNQPDARVFPAPSGYPRYLRARDEIRAKNGYVFTQCDKERKKTTNLTREFFLRRQATPSTYAQETRSAQGMDMFLAKKIKIGREI